MPQLPEVEQGWRRHKLEVDNAVIVAAGELAKIVRANPDASLDEVAAIFHGVANRFRPIAAASAFRALENSRKAYGRWNLPDPEMPEEFSFRQARATTGWALWNATDGQHEQGRQHLPELIGSLGRAVRGGSRDTIFRSVRRAKTLWARVPGVKACWFCLMLASRGAVYRSKDTALIASKTGGAFHDYCDCMVIESYTDADLPNLLHDLRDEWQQTVGIDEHPGIEPQQQRDQWQRYVRSTRPLGYSVREILDDGTAVAYPSVKQVDMAKTGGMLDHAQFNQRAPMIGSHIADDALGKLRPLLLDGTVKMNEPKHFAPADVLREALSPEIISQVVAEPKKVVRVRRGYSYEAWVDLSSGRYMVRVTTGPAPAKTLKSTQVNTAYVIAGPGVGILNPDGSVDMKEGS